MAGPKFLSPLENFVHCTVNICMYAHKKTNKTKMFLEMKPHFHPPVQPHPLTPTNQPTRTCPIADSDGDGFDDDVVSYPPRRFWSLTGDTFCVTKDKKKREREKKVTKCEKEGLDNLVVGTFDTNALSIFFYSTCACFFFISIFRLRFWSRLFAISKTKRS